MNVGHCSMADKLSANRHQGTWVQNPVEDANLFVYLYDLLKDRNK